MPDSSYRRRSAQRKPFMGDEMSDSRRAWLDVNSNRIMMFRGEGDFRNQIPEDATKEREEYEKVLTSEYGEEVIVVFKNGRVTYSLRLTGMTEMELDAFQDFINMAIESARPVTEAKDRISKELFDEQGIDSFPRLYRGVPKVFVRKGEEPLYGESLRRRPFGILEVDGRIRIEHLSTRAERELAARQSQDEEPGHGDEANGEPAGVVEVGWPGGNSPGGLHPSDSGEADAAPDPRGD